MNTGGRPLAALALLATLVGCSERPHEPVKVIAAPRAESPAMAPPAPVPALPAPASAPALPAATPPPVVARAEPPTPASAPLPRLRQAGEPNGNAAFRAALEEKFRAQGQAGATP